MFSTSNKSDDSQIQKDEDVVIKTMKRRGKNWNKFVLLPKIKNDQKARESNFQKHK